MKINDLEQVGDRIEKIKILERKIKAELKDPLDELILDTDKEKLWWMKLQEEKRKHSNTEENRVRLLNENLELKRRLKELSRIDKIENTLAYLERNLIKIFRLSGVLEELDK